MILDPTTAIVGTLAFALHLVGKYKENTTAIPFPKWIGQNIGYALTSIAFCALGLLLKDEIMEPLGFSKPLTFAAVLCYGAGHLVSRILGIANATKIKA